MSTNEPAIERCAEVFQQNQLAGYLEELPAGAWQFTYLPGYDGLAISLTLPTRSKCYRFDTFPAVFDGLLPEGPQLEALLRKHKIDRNDYFRQLLMVGEDMVGSLTVRAVRSSPQQSEGDSDG